MKKVMFTAIAMIAFSSVSMANTIADESVDVLKNKTESLSKESVKIMKKNECVEKALDFYEVIIGNGPEDILLLNQLLSYCK